MRFPACVLLVVAVMVTGCAHFGGESPPRRGEPDEAVTASPTPAGEMAADCDALDDDEPPAGSPSPTEVHTPEYRGGELHRWGRTQAREAFAGLWHAGPTKGWVVMAFAERVEAYRQKVHQRFSDDIRVVGAEHPWVELKALERRVEQDMEAQRRQASRRQRRFPEPGTIVSVGIDNGRDNRVRIGVIGGDAAALADVSARYDTDRICLQRYEHAEPPDGEGPVRRLAKAEDWREGLRRDDESWEALAEIAYDRAAAQRAWEANVPADLPRDPADPVQPGVFVTLADVDFAQEAVVVWSAGESGSCPEWVADLRTDADGTVHLDLDSAGGPACTADYNPYRMVLAVDRDRLPDPSALPTDDVADLREARVTPYP